MAGKRTRGPRRTRGSHRNQRAAIPNRFLQRGGGSRAAAGRPAAFVSQAANGGEWRSRKSRRWLIHGLALRAVCSCVCAWCVSRAHSRWQIGKATDGPGSISTAGCCDVSILPSLTTAGPDHSLSVWLLVRAGVFFTFSFPVTGCVCVCCFKIRGTITLFAKYNKGKSLSWRCRCRTASTANVVDESTGTRQLVERVCLFSCVCVCWYPFTGVCARPCAHIVFCWGTRARSQSVVGTR